MSTLTSRDHHTAPRTIVAGAILALMLVASSSALAQSTTSADNAPVTGPKQVGAWTVTGWSQGYCSAERPVRGADGGASVVQLVLARLRIGYRFALSAQDWELPPQTSFPVELIAEPVMRKNPSAVTAGPKLVIIELGTDGEAVKKLSAASTLEVKTARTTFKLPLDGFAQSFAEVEDCYGALKQPVANPFLPADGAQKPSAASPKSDTPRDPEAPAAAPNKSASDSTTATPSAKPATASVPNAGPAKVDLDDGLAIERTFLA